MKNKHVYLVKAIDGASLWHVTIPSTTVDHMDLLPGSLIIYSESLLSEADELHNFDLATCPYGTEREPYGIPTLSWNIGRICRESYLFETSHVTRPSVRFISMLHLGEYAERTRRSVRLQEVSESISNLIKTAERDNLLKALAEADDTAKQLMIEYEELTKEDTNE